MRRLEEVIRCEECTSGLVLLLRGGTDSREKLMRHADRMVNRFTYQGLPARGISLFSARGDLDARKVLASRLSTYRRYYKVSATDASRLGLLLPTFAAPHWTLLFNSVEGGSPAPLQELASALLDTLGPLLENPKYVPPEAGRS